MKKHEELKDLEDYIDCIDIEIKSLLDTRKDYQLYDMMRYFFGYADENFRPANIYAGKRMRSALCLFFADLYGKKEQCIPVAAAIEIFHNFTLIHDDIEDRDELRRNRPTVWKVWGINHGINTGDAQLLLANIELLKLDCKNIQEVQKFLFECYLQVAEGQFLDFELAENNINDKKISTEKYFEMITKKSAVLIGASVKASGMVLDLDDSEVDNLWKFGLNFGIAYQILDDLASLWSSKEATGKEELNDILEKKKTLPIIYFYEKCNDLEKDYINKFYSKEKQISLVEAKEIKKLIDEKDVFNDVWVKLEYYVKLYTEAIDKMSLDQERKEKILAICSSFLPKVKER